MHHERNTFVRMPLSPSTPPHSQDKKLSDLPVYKTLLTTFNTSEIIRWQLFQSQYKNEFATQTEVFSGARQCCFILSTCISMSSVISAQRQITFYVIVITC